MADSGEIRFKVCGACGATYEGAIVDELHSCEACGAPSLRPVQVRLVHEDPMQRLPKSGGQGLITHTRDNF